MAFGKKKPQDEPVAAEAPEAVEAADAPGGAIDSDMFASVDAAAGEAPQEDASADALPEPAPEPAEAPAAAGDPLSGGPDLLSMFQTTEAVADDRAALLELAGEVEFDDLLEELQTVASALGVRRAS